jgi:phosphoglycerate dehydrogenase-like enzyme
MSQQPLRLLVNLPGGFFREPMLEPIWQQLREFCTLQQTSCNTADEIRPHLRDADAILMWSWPMLTKDLLDEAPALRFSANIDIQQRGARVLLARGIPVSVSRRGFSPAVAEMALLLMLSCLRRTPNHQAAMWSGSESWVENFPDDIDRDERQLAGRRVGIVGFGGVGQRLAQLLQPFACDLKITDPFLPDAVAQQYNAQNVNLNELISHSEILVLCAAANSGSKHLIEASHIEALAPRSIFINVARASLVDNAALLARLQRGDMYAALDVFDKEPLEHASPLRGLPNVYLTPHRAGGVMESVERILQYLVDDLRAWHTGGERRHALSEAMIASLDA